jgi:diadenosine tetraphosphatase ApaH/serine/threonine PP2A family protein phosphatase
MWQQPTMKQSLCPPASNNAKQHHRQLSVSLQGSAQEPPPQTKAQAVARQLVDELFAMPVSRSKPVEPAPRWLASKFKADEISALCAAARELMLSQPAVVDVQAPAKIFGDIHGQLSDLLLFFHTYGMPQHRTGDIEYISYVFLGDFVDRGKFSAETILLVLSLKVLYPYRVWLVRGNHEDPAINEDYGFKEEVFRKFDDFHGHAMFQAIISTYGAMPYCCLIEKKVLCLHGGVGDENISLKRVRNLPRPVTSIHHTDDTGVVYEGDAECSDADRELIASLLWSDPTSDDAKGMHASPRTKGCTKKGYDHVSTFGPDIVTNFTEANGIDVIVRAHECVQDGFLYFAGGHLVTVFSARNYAGVMNNDGAFLLVARTYEGNLQITPKCMKAAGANEPQPQFISGQRDVSPMRSASNYQRWASHAVAYR